MLRRFSTNLGSVGYGLTLNSLSVPPRGSGTLSICGAGGAGDGGFAEGGADGGGGASALVAQRSVRSLYQCDDDFRMAPIICGAL